MKNLASKRLDLAVVLFAGLGLLACDSTSTASADAATADGSATAASAEETSGSSDAAINARVEARLIADPQVNNFEIDVDVEDGVVRLSGNVETEADRAEAENIARNTKGVKDVVNEIEIGDPTFKDNVTDAWIVTKIKSKLTADPDVSPFRIDVDAVEGVVTLSGTVEKEAARDAADALARATRGVREVRNKIKVETS